MRSFKENEKVERIATPAASAQATVTTDVVDTQGFDSVVLTALLGTIAATGTVVATAQQGDESNGSDMASLSGATASADASDDNKLLSIELYRPTKRYVRLSIARGTANSAVDGAIAILRDPQDMPVTRSSDEADYTFLAAPAEA